MIILIAAFLMAIVWLMVIAYAHGYRAAERDLNEYMMRGKGIRRGKPRG